MVLSLIELIYRFNFCNIGCSHFCEPTEFLIHHQSTNMYYWVFFCLSFMLSSGFDWCDPFKSKSLRKPLLSANLSYLYLSQSLLTYFIFSILSCCSLLLSNVQISIVNCCISTFLLSSQRLPRYISSISRVLFGFIYDAPTTLSFFNFLPTHDLSNKDWIHSMTRKWKTSR